MPYRTQKPPKGTLAPAVIDKLETALDMRIRGFSYEAIAQELGYHGKSAPATVYNLIKNALRKREFEAVDEYRKLQLLRIHELMRAIWHKAMAGDLWSIDRLLALMDMENKLLGLYPKDSGEVTREVVIREYGVMVDAV